MGKALLPWFLAFFLALTPAGAADEAPQGCARWLRFGLRTVFVATALAGAGTEIYLLKSENGNLRRELSRAQRFSEFSHTGGYSEETSAWITDFMKKSPAEQDAELEKERRSASARFSVSAAHRGLQRLLQHLPPSRQLEAWVQFIGKEEKAALRSEYGVTLQTTMNWPMITASEKTAAVEALLDQGRSAKGYDQVQRLLLLTDICESQKRWDLSLSSSDLIWVRECYRLAEARPGQSWAANKILFFLAQVKESKN